MQEKDGTPRGGIRLQTVVIVMVAVGVVIALLLTYAMVRTNRGYAQLRDATQDYIECQSAVYDMQRASDYLTEHARLYVMTGNIEHAELYCEEISVTRRRERAVEVIASRTADRDASDQLASARDYSDTLMETELYAMRLAAEGLGEDAQACPEAVSAVTLAEADLALPAEAQIARAREMMFDKYYENMKAQITEQTQLSIDRLIDTLTAHQTASTERLSRLLQAQQGLVILMALILAGTTVIIFTLVIRPLKKQIVGISREQTLALEGAQELRFLAGAFNGMLEQRRRANEKLSYEASHDGLTGLYNRAAYERLRKRWDEEDVALVLVDVDFFKSINDTYGHDMGDRVLRRVAQVLQRSFRGEDMVCRIGGDEFAVIMVHANASLTELVRGKMAQAARILADPQDDLPKVTLSVGVAFASQRGEGEDLFKCADRALYHTKEKGRNGCSFYEPENK